MSLIPKILILRLPYLFAYKPINFFHKINLGTSEISARFGVRLVAECFCQKFFF